MTKREIEAAFDDVDVIEEAAKRLRAAGIAVSDCVGIEFFCINVRELLNREVPSDASDEPAR